MTEKVIGTLARKTSLRVRVALGTLVAMGGLGAGLAVAEGQPAAASTHVVSHTVRAHDSTEVPVAGAVTDAPGGPQDQSGAQVQSGPNDGPDVPGAEAPGAGGGA